MITPIHLVFDVLVYFGIINLGAIGFSYLDLILVFSANLIDLDHLFSRPIYDSRRNPFKTHFLHKKYIILIIISLVLLFFDHIRFLGIGIFNHLLLDYIQLKIKGKFY